MGNRKTDHPEHAHSVADEAYRGPSLGVTAVGYNAVQWKVGIAIGGILGFVTALLIPNKVGAGVKAIEKWIGRNIAVGKQTEILVGKDKLLHPGTGPTSENWLTNRAGEITNWSLRQAHHVGKWAQKSLDNSFSQKIGLTPDRVEKGMLGFGIGGFSGMILSMFTSSAQAYHVNKRAHDQFRRAKVEINDLRAENLALRSMNSEIKTKCDTEVAPAAPIITATDEPKPESLTSEKPTSVIQKELALVPESRLVASQQLAAL